MAVDPQKLIELRNESERQAIDAQIKAAEQRRLAETAPDAQARRSHEAGADSYSQLSAQHAEVARQRQAELAAAQRDAAAEADRRAATARRAAELEAELQRYRESRHRGLGRA